MTPPRPGLPEVSAPQLSKGPWFYVRPFVPFMVSYILYAWLVGLDSQVAEEFKRAAERGESNSYTGLSSLFAFPIVVVFLFFLPFEIRLLNRYTKQLLAMDERTRKVYGWVFVILGVVLIPQLVGSLFHGGGTLAGLGAIPILILGLMWPFFRYGMKLLKSLGPPAQVSTTGRAAPLEATRASRVIKISITWIVATFVFFIFGIGVGGVRMLSGRLGSAMPCGETASTCPGVDTKRAEYQRVAHEGATVFYGVLFCSFGGAILVTKLINKNARRDTLTVTATPPKQ